MHRQIYEYNPNIGYRFIPNLRARIPHESGGYFIRSNSMGFRSDHEFVAEKKKGIHRILLFGDSYTAGEGVSNGSRFGDLLEELIPNVEVYNFGLPGSGTDQQYLIYREFARDIQHDVTIIAMLVENIRRITAHYRLWNDEHQQPVYYEKPYFELAGNKLNIKNIPPSKKAVQEGDLPKEERKYIDKGGRFPKMEKILRKSGLKERIQEIIHYQPLPEYNNPESLGWQLMCKIIEQWTIELPSKVMLMTIPIYQYVEGISDPSKYQERFKELAGNLELVLYDPLSDLLRYPLEKRRGFHFKTDVHPNKTGHGVLASFLAPVVDKIIGDTLGIASK